MGSTRDIVIQEERYGRGGHISGVEETQGELRGVRGGAMSAASLHNHMERTHGIVLSHNRGVELGGWGAKTSVVSFPRVLKLVVCRVDGCPARAKKSGRLREQFIYRNWKAKVEIIHEGPEPLPI